LKERTGVDAELIRGSNGIFDVVVDGKTLFSKDTSGRFPNPGEIAAQIQS
jgi:selT/selW/selH-like putative selenoprotein